MFEKEINFKQQIFVSALESSSLVKVCVMIIIKLPNEPGTQDEQNIKMEVKSNEK